MKLNFEFIMKIVGTISAFYLFLQIFIPVIRYLLAQGIAGLILVLLMVWWLFQEKKK